MRRGIKYAVAAGLLLATLAPSCASAEPGSGGVMFYPFEGGAAHRASAGWHRSNAGRPADCYGIPWCGCWLRHYFHIADKRLNAVSQWPKLFGRRVASPAVGRVAVFWHSHVGVITGIIDAKTVMVKSGNTSGGVREAPRKTSTIRMYLEPTS